MAFDLFSLLLAPVADWAITRTLNAMIDCPSCYGNSRKDGIANNAPNNIECSICSNKLDQHIYATRSTVRRDGRLVSAKAYDLSLGTWGWGGKNLSSSVQISTVNSKGVDLAARFQIYELDNPNRIWADEVRILESRKDRARFKNVSWSVKSDKIPKVPYVSRVVVMNDQRESLDYVTKIRGAETLRK